MAAPRLVRLAGALALLALLVAPALPGATGSRVLAHAQLVASSPGAGEVVAEAPAELRLAFSEPLEAQVTSLDLRTAEGEPILDRAGEIAPEDPFTLVAELPDLADGAYAVTWRTLSAADGHTVEGTFSFGVGDVELAGDGTTATHTETDLADVAGRFVSYVGLLGALGLAVFASVVLRSGSPAAPFLRLLATGLALAGVAALAVGVMNALEAGGIGSYLLGSRNGMLQLARGLVALGGAGLLLVLPRRTVPPVAAALALIGIGLLVAAGHSAALPGPVPILVGIVHVAGAGVWLGGVAGLALLGVRPRWLGIETAPPWRSIVPRFSALALVAIGLVGASGVVSAWWQTGTLVSPDTEYGRALIVKSLVAVGALALGGLNFLDGGRLRAWLGGLPTRALAESGIGLAVLVATGVLATTSPIDATPGVAIRPVPDAFGEIAPDMTLELVPGRPGVNRAVVTTTDALATSGINLELVLDRLDGGSTTRVELHHPGMAGMEGMEGMDGHVAPVVSDSGTVAWTADAIVLAPGSRWDANVLTLSSAGAELGRQRYAFTVGDAAIDEGADSDLLTPVVAIAAVLLLGGALGLGLGAGGWPLPRCDAATSRIALLTGGSVAVVTGTAIGIDSFLRL
jgi:copper transport protein